MKGLGFFDSFWEFLAQVTGGRYISKYNESCKLSKL